MSNPVLSERGRLNSLQRYRNPDDPEIAKSRLELRAAGLAEHIRREVEKAPPLTVEQRDRLAALLRAS